MLPSWYNDYKNKIEFSLDVFLDQYFKVEQNIVLQDFAKGVKYATRGGKRIRAILALEFYLIFSKKNIIDIENDADIMKFCIALELLHAYSLVHDDLPCMDNDDYRRGELTTWKKYGETQAVLIGDLLNSLAFEILGEIEDSISVGILVQMFGNSVGISGMLGGQVLDLYYEQNPEALNLKSLEEIHNKKTGKLISMSILGGIILSGQMEEVVNYSQFGKNIGLAFQIKDDLLDVEGTFEETGKSVATNINDMEKKGFVYFLGLEKTKKYLQDILLQCHGSITELHSTKLDFLVEYIGNRDK